MSPPSCEFKDMHIGGVLCKRFLRPIVYRLTMGIVKARKLRERPKIILFSKTVLDYGNRSADIYLVIQTAGQAGNSISMCILRSLWDSCS